LLDALPGEQVVEPQGAVGHRPRELLAVLAESARRDLQSLQKSHRFLAGEPPEVEPAATRLGEV